MENKFLFQEDQFDRLFPFFIRINQNTEVTSVGRTLEKIFAGTAGNRFSMNYAISRPRQPEVNFTALKELSGQLVVIECNNKSKTALRGQLEYLPDSNEVVFLGSPWFGSMEQIIENKLTLHDFAYHDPMIDLLHVLKTQEITTEDLKQLLKTINRQKNELKLANEEIHEIALFPQENPDPLIRINTKGEILRRNPAAELLEYLEYEHEIYSPQELLTLIATRIDIKAERWIFEARSGKKDFSFACIPMEKEGYINIYGRDVTQQNINQQELEQLSLIIQQTQNAVVITDAAGKIEWVNTAFENVTGYHFDEVKGKSPGSFLQGRETDPETVAYMKQRIREAKPFTCEILNYKKSGEGYWLRINGQPIFDKQGNVIRFFAIEEDITFEKQAQEKMKAAASRMSSLITNLHAGILLENEDRTIALINQRFCDLFGIPVTPEKMIGADCSRAAAGSSHLFSDPDKFVSDIGKILDNKETVIGDKLELADGRFLERDFIPIWNEGRYDGHLWVYTDITEKLTADKKLEEQRTFYEEILDNIPADIAVFDNQHRYLYVNPRGISDPELRKWLVGKKDEDYIKKRNKPASILTGRRNLFNRIVETRQLESWEEELIQPDGSSRYIMRNMYPVVGHDNNVDLVIGYGVDITNIKTIQQQIEQSEKRYRDVIDNSLAIVTTHDMDGRFLTVNPMVKKLYGYEDDEVIGRSLTDFMPETDRVYFEENYLNIIKGKKEATGIFRVLHKNGSVVYSLYNNYLKEESGKEPYVIGFAVDITDRVLAEKELKIAKKVTEELAQTKQNFLANMSHEIRTPMNAIMGMSRQLQKTALNEKQQVYLDTITSATENLLIIINDILDLSKMEAGKLALEKIGFEPKKVVGSVLQVMAHKAEEKGLELTNSYCDRQLSPILLGDPYRLSQVLLNLVSNAIKFTAVGVVDISCTVLDDTEKLQRVEIKVADTGIGMGQAFVKNLFDNFSQEDEAVARQFGGTGLGMSITKSLVELMEGEIAVESEKGKGTVVKIRLDFEKGKETDLPKRNTVITDVSNLTHKKILIADDNEMNRLVAATILNEYGVQVTEVINGAEAIKQIQLNNYDLVLMDIQMPVLDGYEATQIIRRELKSVIPVIALTANAIKGESEKCIQAGMNDYLSKPFEEKQLIQLVSQWLDKDKTMVGQPPADVKTIALYDLGKLEEIARGNRQFIDKMIQLFINQAPSSVAEIETAFDAGDYSKVKAVAHRMKPSIDNMGILSLKNDIREIENFTATSVSTHTLKAQIGKLRKVIDEVVAVLKNTK